MKKVAVIGMGPAGLMAAYTAAKNGAAVTLFDHNEKAGKKLFITGKGRCNLTNKTTPENFLTQVVNNPKFLYGAIHSFTPEDTIRFFTEHGLKLKTERGNRVFPENDHAYSVTDTLVAACKKHSVKFCYDRHISGISTQNQAVTGLLCEGEYLKFDTVIVATGGKSYPSTGSTGDGYTFAKSVGHTVAEARPALSGIELFDNCKPLAGLALKNVTLSAVYCGKLLRSEFGELTFMDYGISGPIALTVSSLITRLDPSSVFLTLDLKPALDADTLERRLLRDFEEWKNCSMQQSLVKLLPHVMILPVLSASGIDPEKKNHSLTKEERKKLLSVLKEFPLHPKCIRSLDEAIVTSGGVSVKEINPKTMESKLCKNLFFAGEVLDVDAFTGGYNIQIALSTGVAAGKGASEND